MIRSNQSTILLYSQLLYIQFGYSFYSSIIYKMGSTLLPIDQLRASLTASDVLVPGDEGYQSSLHRWSEAAEKPAVSVCQHWNP